MCAKLVEQNTRTIREEAGLTQEQLAEISGFSQQHIRGLEKGKRNPSFDLAQALRVSHIDLVRPG
nr:helix-turn-helix transcriptional regulator [Mesorhizobium sp. LCM 4577]